MKYLNPAKIVTLDIQYINYRQFRKTIQDTMKISNTGFSHYVMCDKKIKCSNYIGLDPWTAFFRVGYGFGQNQFRITFFYTPT